jgi:hypothetical protein
VDGTSVCSKLFMVTSMLGPGEGLGSSHKKKILIL